MRFMSLVIRRVNWAGIGQRKFQQSCTGSA